MTPRTVAALIAAVATVGLAGCGGDDDDGGDNGIADKSADEILDETKKAVADEDSGSIAGDVGTGDEAGSVDVQFSDAGSKGTVGIQGVEFDFLSVDGNFYMKADADAWDQFAGEGTGQLVADKYVLIPEEQMGGFSTFTDKDGLIEDVLTPDGEVSVGDETEVDGQKVIGLTSEKEGVLYVATTDTPLPVQLKAPEEEGSLDFEWDVDVEISAPPEDEVLDFSELGS